jgi:hypothetical protein
MADDPKPVTCPECGEEKVKLTETFTRYSRVRIIGDKLQADYEWPPDLDDGAEDYELVCECGHRWDIPAELNLDFEWAE